MPAEFTVVPDDLDKFGSAMGDLAGQAGAAVQHVTKWLELQNAETGIFVQVKEIVEQIQEDLTANYKHLQTLSDRSADELGKAAQLYRTTDYEQARELDQTYPEPAR